MQITKYFPQAGKIAADEKDPLTLFLTMLGTASGQCPPDQRYSWQEATREIDNMFLPTGKVTVSSELYSVTFTTEVDWKDSKKALVFLNERQELTSATGW